MPSIVQENSLSTIYFTILQDPKNSVPVDLTGAAVKMRYRIGAHGPLRIINSITVTDFIGGKCEHRFLPGELDLVGLLVGDLEIIKGTDTGRIFKFSVDVLEGVN